MKRSLILWLCLLSVGCGDDRKHAAKPEDTVPPGTIHDLRAFPADSVSVFLEWTAPGNDDSVGTAAGYDLRYASGDSASWERMTRITGVAAPRPAGSTESFRVVGLMPGTAYTFLARTADEAGNLSGFSDTVRTETAGADRTPPAEVTDLRAARTTDTSVTLRWTSPGDDRNLGAAARYEIRVGAFHNDIPEWNTASPVSGAPLPATAGTVQEVVVTGLTASQDYFFLLRAIDDAGNASGLSNRVDWRTGGPEDSHWWDGFAPPPDGLGVDGNVTALAVYRDELFVGGTFHKAGGLRSPYLAAWNGVSWRSLYAPDEPVRALCLYRGDLIVGGDFPSLSSGQSPFVAAFKGTHWADLGEGLPRPVTALAVVGDSLFAYSKDRGVYRWDEGDWTRLPAPPIGLPVTTLAGFRGVLYAGGGETTFSPADSDRYVARWSGSTWTTICSHPYAVPVPEYCCPSVRTLFPVEDALLAGTLGVTCAGPAGRYDGGGWSVLGLPVRDLTWPDDISGVASISAFGTWRSRLVAGGHFLSGPENAPTVSMLYREGGSWLPLGTGIGRFRVEVPGIYWLEGEVLALVEYHGSLYAGGTFAVAGGKPSAGIARWDE